MNENNPWEETQEPQVTVMTSDGTESMDLLLNIFMSGMEAGISMQKAEALGVTTEDEAEKHREEILGEARKTTDALSENQEAIQQTVDHIESIVVAWAKWKKGDE